VPGYPLVLSDRDWQYLGMHLNTDMTKAAASSPLWGLKQSGTVWGPISSRLWGFGWASCDEY
jgi:hypothetical protein